MLAALLIVLFAVGAVVEGAERGVKVDEVINNKVLFKHYVDCILDKGKCPPEAAKIKAKIPNALENDCGECEAEEKEDLWKIITHLVKNDAETWKSVVAKYDPEGKYKEKYSAELKKRGLDF